MNPDIRQTQVYQNLLAAYQNNLKQGQQPPPVEQQMIIITQMLSKYALPNDVELFFTSMAGAWLAQQAKDQGLHEQATKNH